MIKTKGCKLLNKSDHPSENTLSFYETNSLNLFLKEM